jgi:hypothetical protein
MHNSVENSVSLTVFNANIFQNWGKSHWHSLQLSLRQPLQTLSLQVVLGVYEESVFLAFAGQLGIFRISLVKVCLNLDFKKLLVLAVQISQLLNLLVSLLFLNGFLFLGCAFVGSCLLGLSYFF